MVYARKNRFRKNFRNNRVLSTKRIFNNKTAKAQASQIWALRKRVNRVYQRTKPEVKVAESNYINNVGFGNFGAPGVAQTYAQSITMPSTGTSDSTRIGNIISLLPFKLYINLQYEEIYNSLRNGFSTVKIPLASHGISLRLFAIQAKMSGVSQPTYDELMELGALNNDPVRASMFMTSPFKTGITGKYNILYNRVFHLSEDKPLISRTLTIRPKIKTIQWTDGTSTPKGQIFWYVISSGWDMNTYDPGASSDLIKDYNFVNFTWSARTPFTDA